MRDWEPIDPRGEKITRREAWATGILLVIGLLWVFSPLFR